ncbi:MAG: helix-turn-helix domain-containing protein [Butyricimonas faecihominis]
MVRQIGFATQSSLSRFFRRQTGMSPSEYRRTVHVIR